MNRWIRRGAVGLALVALGALGACSVALDVSEEQCDVDADCAARGFAGARCVDRACVDGGGEGGGGGAVDPKWGCLGSFDAPVPEGDTIVHSFRFEYAIQANVPPPGLAVRLCASLDVDCGTPLESPQPDETGLLQLELPASFTGFLEVESDDTMPSLAFLETPVVLPPTTKVIRLIGETSFESLVAAAEQTWDPARGVAVILTSDCLDERTAGVSIASSDVDQDTVGFYFQGNLPDPQATSTDGQGAAGFLNLPIGIVTIEAARFETGERIGNASFRSRPGTLSYVPIGPTE